jgi:probable HAF family extracellular repeat protein
MNHARTIAAAALAVSALVPNVALAQGSQDASAALVTYEVVDLGAAGFGSRAVKINDRNQVAGSVGFDPNSCNPSPCPYPSSNPAIFRSGRPAKLLNNLNAEGGAINGLGEVVGQVSGSGFPSFFWNPDRGTTNVPAAYLLAINDASTAVGYAAESTIYAAKYENGVVSALGTWGGDLASATGIDNAGAIVGFRTFNQTGVTEAMRLLTNGTLQSLSPPLPTALISFPNAVSGGGNVTGTLSLDGIRYTAFALISGRYSKIEYPGAPFTIGYGINDRGSVVGLYETAGVDQRAFLWERGTITDLSTLPEVAAAGWNALVTATGINTRGVIVGIGVRNSGDTHGFMLIPRRR